jgi:uncharacterized membrane protein
MTPDNNINVKARVSIVERLVPSLGFAVAAMSGALGGVMVLQFLNSLRNAAMAGRESFFMGTAKIEAVVGAVLAVAAVLGAIGILVAVIRLFTKNKKASPPGVLFLPLGLLALIPPFAIHYGLHLMEEIVGSQSPGGISMVGETETLISYFSIVAPFAIILALLAFSFIPFTSRLGRKISPILFLIVVEIAVVALCAIFFWQASHSMSHAGARLF